jgi:hypothetical protein
MILPLRTKHLRFVYTFGSGHQLVGTVEGDYFPNSPNIVFNLRSLQAICFNPDGGLLLSFDDVYGQLDLNVFQTIFSGSHSEQGSFFSFSGRSREATIYDAESDTWIATGWNPKDWDVEDLSKSKYQSLRPLLSNAALANKAIA